MTTSLPLNIDELIEKGYTVLKVPYGQNLVFTYLFVINGDYIYVTIKDKNDKVLIYWIKLCNNQNIFSYTNMKVFVSPINFVDNEDCTIINFKEKFKLVVW